MVSLWMFHHDKLQQILTELNTRQRQETGDCKYCSWKACRDCMQCGVCPLLQDSGGKWLIQDSEQLSWLGGLRTRVNICPDLLVVLMLLNSKLVPCHLCPKYTQIFNVWQHKSEETKYLQSSNAGLNLELWCVHSTHSFDYNAYRHWRFCKLTLEACQKS